MTEKQGFWCQGDCVWIEASDGSTAVEKYRHRLSKGSIGIDSHNPDAMRVREYAARVQELEKKCQRLSEALKPFAAAADSFDVKKRFGWPSFTWKSIILAKKALEE